ncbi:MULTISPECIES: hypothetical protein [Prevotellaceae]|uniref:hypothetical protein n=1 Tax=Prevotellaceae TaxID=171552 RepID=UPI0003D2B9A9|nr:hypothetical protein [Prevotella phocaeensis]ETD18582.1 hypothetical protein HMPREF1199_01400 [Hoylesella oralis CC98A]
MKTKEMIQRISLFLFVLVLAALAWAQGNNGNEVVSIGSKEDWQAFCNRVNNNGETGLNAKLTTDINLGTDIVMLGKYSPYKGTFDGQGHTLKFDWDGGSRDDIAPFKYVRGATIRNLRTQGKITTKGSNLSGLVLEANGGTTTISRCVTDVDITGGRAGEASYAAGLIQTIDLYARVTITDCVVKGSITDNEGDGWQEMAGFVYVNSGSCTLTNCLYVSKNNASNENCRTFADGNANTLTLTNCYYLTACGKVQGEHITEARLASGEVTKLLQDNRENLVWGQTLGTDNEPQLIAFAPAAEKVYQVKFSYNGKVTATRYANNGGKVKLPTAQELLGTAYDATKTYTLAFDGGNFSATTTISSDRTVNVTVTTPTGIDGVTDDRVGERNAAVYDLAGRRVADRLDAATRSLLPAGVYIVGGRKVIVK